MNRATTSTLNKNEGVLERIKEREINKRGKSVASRVKPTPFLHLRISNASSNTRGDYEQDLNHKSLRNGEISVRSGDAFMNKKFLS